MTNPQFVIIDDVCYRGTPWKVTQSTYVEAMSGWMYQLYQALDFPSNHVWAHENELTHIVDIELPWQLYADTITKLVPMDSRFLVFVKMKDRTSNRVYYRTEATLYYLKRLPQ